MFLVIFRAEILNGSDFTTRGHMAMSPDIFGCSNGGEVGEQGSNGI